MSRILIIGAGVIGSIYGSKLIKSGNNVTFLDKENRINDLKKNGLVLKWLNTKKEERLDTFQCIDNLSKTDLYDYIIVTVQKNQLISIYPYLKENMSENIVFMVNNPDGSKEYYKYFNKQKVIMGFPGAGGEVKNGIVYCHIVSGLIQPTTIGTMNIENNKSVEKLKNILKGADFYVSINSNMDSWLINHLAMVCPLGNAIYTDGGDNYSLAKNDSTIKMTVKALKESFLFIKKSKIGINPSKFNFILYCPSFILVFLLKLAYNTNWANTVIFKHCSNAREEMRELSKGFLEIVNRKNGNLPFFNELASYNN